MSQSTDVVPAFIERGKIVLRKPEATLDEIATAVVEDLPVQYVAPAQEFPPPAPKVEITEEARAALDVLAEVFGVVQPEVRCSLNEDQLAALYAEREVVRIIKDLVSGREEAIKEIIRHHMDVAAEESGVAVPKAVIRGGHTVVEATPRDEHGHYILCAKGAPEQVKIKGTNKKWSREFRSGSKAVTIVDVAELAKLREAGEISHEDWLAMTKQVRVIDRDKLKDALREEPRRLSILRRITKRTAGSPGTSLTVR